jgi:hypothetical protein
MTSWAVCSAAAANNQQQLIESDDAASVAQKMQRWSAANPPVIQVILVNQEQGCLRKQPNTSRAVTLLTCFACCAVSIYKPSFEHYQVIT